MYVWDLSPWLKPLARGPVLAPKELERLWTALASDNAIHARKALWKIVASPEGAVPFLAQQLRPIPAASEAEVAQLIADLDANRPPARRRAQERLELLSRHVEAALKKALAQPASLQQSRSLEPLVQALNPPYTSPERLRRLRAIEVLERISSPEARQLLWEIAKGAAGAPETEDAKAALQRLARKQPPTP
jgi:hypothetical protein